jgi:hypothetical protein
MGSGESERVARVVADAMGRTKLDGKTRLWYFLVAKVGIRGHEEGARRIAGTLGACRGT